MKVFVTLTMTCLALATALQVQSGQGQGAGSGSSLISGQQAVQLVGNSPHIVIGNRQLNGVAGYYVPVPYEILAAVSSPSSGAQLINHLRQNGIVPIWNAGGSLIALYTQALGNNQQGNINVNTLIQNLAGISLSPIVNQQNQVIGLYASNPSTVVGPNQVNQLEQQWSQSGVNPLNSAQQQWSQSGNNLLNNAQQQWSQGGNNQLNNAQQQWSQGGNNPSSSAQQQWSQGGNNPSSSAQQQGSQGGNNPSSSAQQQRNHRGNNPSSNAQQGQGNQWWFW